MNDLQIKFLLANLFKCLPQADSKSKVAGKVCIYLSFILLLESINSSAFSVAIRKDFREKVRHVLVDTLYQA